jgi:hypothetical protein
LNFKRDILASKFAIKFNLYRYTEDTHLDNAREASEAELLSFGAASKGAKAAGKGLVVGLCTSNQVDP